MRCGSTTISWKSWILVRLEMIIFDEEHEHEFQPGQPTKFTNNSRRIKFQDILPLSDDNKGGPSQKKKIIITWAWQKVNKN